VEFLFTVAGKNKRKKNMRVFQWTLWTLFGSALLGVAVFAGGDAKSKGPPAEMIGSWEQVVAQNGNQVIPADAAKNGTVKLLHLTPTHFQRVAYLSKTKQLLGVAGGRLKFADGVLTESIDFADEASRKAAEGQKPLEFRVELKQDLLTLTRVAANPPYSEVWKRIRD
jgi:hypothetical protein